jgi:hypothetical protein
MTIKFDKQSQIVFAKKFGASGIADIIELINHGVSLGEKHNCFKILYNMQEAEETASFLESYEFHKNLIQMTDLTLDHCCAVVFSPLENKSEKLFYETVATNWGQTVFKIFCNLDEGLAWLKNQKTIEKSHFHQ